jgi:fused signal recognition particle receptor
MILKFLKSKYDALTSALKKTRSKFADRLHALFSTPIDESKLEELEAIFYEADLGVKLSHELIQKTRSLLRKKQNLSSDEVLHFLEQELVSDLLPFDYSMHQAPVGELSVMLVVGANGQGKTTAIAKLASAYTEQGKKVLLAAGDTFRAGAQEQLSHWAQKIGCDIVTGNYKSDPAAVVFDAIQAAHARSTDILLIDTAGRLENKTHLMQELEKIKRSCQKLNPSYPHETLLVLDATMGQHALSYAKTFSEFTPLTGMILTKMDGTTKGGAALYLQKELKIPIKCIGTGEGAKDMAPFDPKRFVHALFFEDSSSQKMD